MAVYHTFLYHYYDYLVSARGLTAIAVVLPILLCLLAEVRKPFPRRRKDDISGCKLLGLQGRSNLDDQYNSTKHGTSEDPRVKALFVFPVKSCRGVELPAAAATATGLKYDRVFSFAQLVSKKPKRPEGSLAEPDEEIVHEWRFITQREFPRLALLRTELWVPVSRQGKVNGVSAKAKPTLEHDKGCNSSDDQMGDWEASGGCLVVRFPYEKETFLGHRTETVTIRLPLQPTLERAKAKGYSPEKMTIWKDSPVSINLSSEIDHEVFAKLKYFLGVSNPLGLFRVDNMNLRSITRSLPKDHLDEAFKVGFADAFPVHLLNIASVRAIDDALPCKSEAKSKLNAVRFRANIYIEGPQAYDEDTWMRIAVGQAADPHEMASPALYHVSCRTARCTLPNVHPDSGIKDRNEPHSTLKKTRVVDEGAKPHPCLGLSMIPLFSRGVIRVGDKVDVLQTGEHVYQKMFA